MKKFDNLYCTIMSTPIIENESPYYITFDVEVQNDVVKATFIGNFARALINNIKIGDRAIIRQGLIDQGRLVFDFMHLESHTAVGRNINLIA